MMEKFQRFFTLLKTLLVASIKAWRSGGVGVGTQFREMIFLWRLPNRLSPTEYFEFSLYDRRFSWEEKQQFIGWRSPVPSMLQRNAWHALANDKLIYYGVMVGMGFPVPRIYALLHRGGRPFGDALILRNNDELAGFLRSSATFPFYGKPVHGLYGEGNVLCTAYIAETDSLKMASGELVGVNDFVANLMDRGGSGYLFQEVLSPSAGMVQLWGKRLSTVRVVVALVDSGPKVLYCEWKIPVGSNIIDNFHNGVTGNMIASVDIVTGQIRSVTLPDCTISFDTSLTHPDTGVAIVGAVLPDWFAIKAIALRSAVVFPGLELQGWDIVPTDTGVIPLEVNLLSGLTAYNHQHFGQRGLLDGDVRRRLDAVKR